MTTFYDLPAPTDSEKLRSDALFQQIRHQIQKKGAISFAEFMKMALYHAEHGYYMAKQNVIGADGDFITAPEISPLFAECMATPCIEVLNKLDSKQILELGAGSGRLAGDLLTSLDKEECLPEKYFIFEISPGLKQKQIAYLKQHAPRYFSRIIWLDEIPESFTGIIIANEVIDALPVHRFMATSTDVAECYVKLENESLGWDHKTPDSDAIHQAALQIKNQHLLGDGYQFEINFALSDLIKSLANSLEQGIVLLADYGYGQNEYYHPQRTQGTLTCFYKHHHHNNPLFYPGLQDITAHVDFTRVIELASAQGFELAGFTTQAGFLLGCGLMDKATLLETSLNEVERFKLHQAIKTLTLPTEMGDVIKIMALTKNFPIDICGFDLPDRRRDL